MMTRKDYVATAEILHGFKDLIGDQLLFEDLVDEFSLMFESDNERFDHVKFFNACHKESEMAK
jgi:hypothetical protein